MVSSRGVNGPLVAKLDTVNMRYLWLHKFFSADTSLCAVRNLADTTMNSILVAAGVECSDTARSILFFLDKGSGAPIFKPYVITHDDLGVFPDISVDKQSTMEWVSADELLIISNFKRTFACRGKSTQRFLIRLQISESTDTVTLLEHRTFHSDLCNTASLVYTQGGITRIVIAGAVATNDWVIQVGIFHLDDFNRQAKFEFNYYDFYDFLTTGGAPSDGNY